MRISLQKVEPNVILVVLFLIVAAVGSWYAHTPEPTAAEAKENLRVFCERDWTGSPSGVQEAVLSMCERASPEDYSGEAKT